MILKTDGRHCLKDLTEKREEGDGMFIGTIDSLEESHVNYPAMIQKALDYLRDHDFTKMEDGRYPIDGELCVANLQRYTTRKKEECRAETHCKYVDIQFLVEGEEYMGWCPFSPDLAVSRPYDTEKDVTFYESLVPDSDIVLSPGCFVVLYPEDVHRPQGAVEDMPGSVTKVVVKIAVDCL